MEQKTIRCHAKEFLLLGFIKQNTQGSNDLRFRNWVYRTNLGLWTFIINQIPFESMTDRFKLLIIKNKFTLLFIPSFYRIWPVLKNISTEIKSRQKCFSSLGRWEKGHQHTHFSHETRAMEMQIVSLLIGLVIKINDNFMAENYEFP